MQTRPGDSEDFPPGSDIDESRIPQPYHLFITCHIMRGSRAGLTPAGKKVGHHGGRNHHTNHPVLHATPLRGKISCKAEYLWGSLATLAATCLFLLSRHFLPGSVATFIALLAASLLPLAGKPLRDADIRAISMGNCCIGLTLLSWGICSLIVPDFTLYADWLITIGAMLYAVLTINQSRISWNM